VALFNIFSDPVIAARQDQLNAQWIALYGAQQHCDGLPDTGWLEFINDYKAWQAFYDSGTDWTASANNATNEWQKKLQDWTGRFQSYGCLGSLGSVDGEEIAPDVGTGLPTVKDPPPDQKSLLASAGDEISGVVGSVKDGLATASYVVVGLVVFVLLLVVYSLTHVRASTPYGSVG
jgi:hypothetical protein